MVAVLLAVAVLVYIAASLFFSYFPILPHHAFNKRLSRSVMRARHVSHRGCRLEHFPENTLAAFQHALRCKTDMVELDVQETKDGKVVVFHDRDLARMCGGVVGKIADFDYADLPRVRPIEEVQVAVDPGVRESDEATKIPLLEDVLEILPQDVCLIVELKHRSTSLVARTHAILTKHKRTNVKGKGSNTLWFSLDSGTNDLLRRHDPTMPTITSIREMLAVLGLYFTGLLPFVPIKADVFGVPCDKVDAARVHHALALAPWWQRAVLVWFVQYFGGDPPMFLIHKALHLHLGRRCVPTFLLGINTEQALEIARRNAACAVLTDRPQWLRARLLDRSLTPRFLGW